MKNLESVFIVFEDCIIFNLDVDSIRTLQMSGISENLYITSGTVDINKECQSLYLSLDKANLIENLKHSVSISNYKDFINKMEDFDISYFILKFYDDNPLSIYVPWHHVSAITNAYQRYYETSDSIIISVVKD